MKRKMFLVLVLGLLLSACGWVVRPVEVTAHIVEISQAGEEGLVTATMSIEQVDDKYPGGVSGGSEGMFKKHIKTIFDSEEFSRFNIGDKLVLVCRTTWFYELNDDSCFVKP